MLRLIVDAVVSNILLSASRNKIPTLEPNRNEKVIYIDPIEIEIYSPFFVYNFHLILMFFFLLFILNFTYLFSDFADIFDITAEVVAKIYHTNTQQTERRRTISHLQRK